MINYLGLRPIPHQGVSVLPGPVTLENGGLPATVHGDDMVTSGDHYPPAFVILSPAFENLF